MYLRRASTVMNRNLPSLMERIRVGADQPVQDALADAECGNGFVRPVEQLLHKWSPSFGGSGLLSSGAFAFTGPGGRSQGERAFGGIRVPGSGVLPGTDGQDNAVIQATAPGIEFAARMPLGAAVVGAGPAQRGEGD